MAIRKILFTLGATAASLVIAVAAHAQADNANSAAGDKDAPQRPAEAQDTTSDQQQQKTNQTDADAPRRRSWDAEESGMFDRYRHHYENRFQAGSLQDFKTGDTERFNRYSDVAEPWTSRNDAVRDWNTSDYYWRQTDRYWRDPARREDPKYDAYWKSSDEYWDDRTEFWEENDRDRPVNQANQRTNINRSDAPSNEASGQHNSGNNPKN